MLKIELLQACLQALSGIIHSSASDAFSGNGTYRFLKSSDSLFIFLLMKSCFLCLFCILSHLGVTAQMRTVIEGRLVDEPQAESTWIYLYGYEGCEFFIRDSCLVSDGRFRLEFTSTCENRYELYLPAGSRWRYGRIGTAPGDRQKIRVRQGKIHIEVGTKQAAALSLRDSIAEQLRIRIDTLRVCQDHAEYGSTAYRCLRDSIRKLERIYFYDLPMRCLNEEPFRNSEILCFDALNTLVGQLPVARFDSLLLVLQHRFPHNPNFSQYKAPDAAMSSDSRRTRARMDALIEHHQRK